MVDRQPLEMPVLATKVAENLESLTHVLISAARASPCARLLVYPRGNVSDPIDTPYSSLYEEAREKSRILRSLDGFIEGDPVLLHLEDHSDLILWFWVVVLAGGVPVPTPPFSHAPEQRGKQIRGLSDLFGSPICITRQKALSLFDGPNTLRLCTIESMPNDASSQAGAGDEACSANGHGTIVRDDDLAVLMMTSGSTGAAKAVQLTHRQILAAVKGKASVRQLPRDKPFLNWIGLDHVASLVEIHIQALRLQVDQVHVHASDIVSSPRTFLDLLSRHQVSRSFAPNFFLAKLVAESGSSEAWDLSSLTVLASGGEANDIETCIETSRLLSQYGAPRNVVTPGFGMTETCAGAIFNLDCPDYDIQAKSPFASLGKCMEGIEMRITLPTIHGSLIEARAGESGDLEVRGDVVFQSYYRNEEATAEAFTPDGWFRTGDRATIDSNGSLHLIGRTKEVMNINGVKISSVDVQATLEEAVAALVARVVVFPSRSRRSRTEQVTVAYVPKSWPLPAQDLVTIDGRLVQACLMCTGSRPFAFPLGDESLLPRTSLGKISRAVMKSMFESGGFADRIWDHEVLLEEYRRKCLDVPATESEAQLIGDFVEILGTDRSTIGVDSPVFEIGFTSLDLVRLKRRIDTRLQIDLPIITIMKNPTARSLACAILDLGPEQLTRTQSRSDQTKSPYDPVVTFRAEGSKVPLWLIHPGVGEVLVFAGLAQHMAGDDRPVHALRARGFEPGQRRFASIAEAVDTYLAAMRETQPAGPYAMAGYSYGTMLAFEVAKKLEAAGETVQFLGSFNLPPHIKSRMRQLNWNRCLLHLAMFLALVPEDYADGVEDEIPDLQRGDALALILGAADKPRMAQLALDADALANWADLAFGLQSMAADYEPGGSVASIDVFHATPLKMAAKSREDWVRNHMGRWKDFCRTEPRLHEVGGAHYTMIGPEHVEGFAAALKAALKQRGL